MVKYVTFNHCNMSSNLIALMVFFPLKKANKIYYFRDHITIITCLNLLYNHIICKIVYTFCLTIKFN